MKPRAVPQARWMAHSNGVNPSPAMRAWLTDRVSLTVKLIARSRHFRVQRLRQARAMCLRDEFEVFGFSRRFQVQEREVLLRCDGRPVVYAHTIVPLDATASDWPFFSALGERSLGTTLFGDPQVRRGALQFARLHKEHPLVQRACAALEVESLDEPLYARRCLFRRKSGALLVTEIFLPALHRIEVLEPPAQLVRPGITADPARLVNAPNEHLFNFK